MKKEGVLLLVLLAGIPGCGGKKYDTQYDIPAEEQVEEVEYVADLDGTDSVRSFFNEETGTFEVDEFDDQFVADLEEWVFADDLEFPSMAENTEEESMSEHVKVAEYDTDAGSDDEQQPEHGQQALEESFKTVFFDKNSAYLREDQKEVVAHNVAHAKKIMEEYRDDAGHPNACTLVVEGHTDSNSESEEISQLRAQTLANAFIEAGIAEECICVASRGASTPMIVDGKSVDAHSAEQWANRRGEIHMICA